MSMIRELFLPTIASKIVPIAQKIKIESIEVIFLDKFKVFHHLAKLKKRSSACPIGLSRVALPKLGTLFKISIGFTDIVDWL